MFPILLQQYTTLTSTTNAKILHHTFVTQKALFFCHASKHALDLIYTQLNGGRSASCSDFMYGRLSEYHAIPIDIKAEDYRKTREMDCRQLRQRPKGRKRKEG